jgi:hypothetical protein
MPRGFPLDAYLDTFESNPIAAEALFWATSGYWQFSDYRRVDVQWVNVHPHPLLLQLGHVHALLLLPPQQGALGMQGSERVTLRVGDIFSVRRRLLPLPRFNVSLLLLQLQTFLLTLHSHRGFPLGMLCSSRMLERYPPSHLPRRSSMASDTTMRNGVRCSCPSFATQRGALTQLRHTTSSTYSEHLCGTT